MKFSTALRGVSRFAVSLFAVSTACAAELPTRAAPAPDASEKARTCIIDGEKGMLLPGGNTCIRISGSVSAQISAGSLAHQRSSVQP